MDEKNEMGFKVKDKRIFTPDGKPKTEPDKNSPSEPEIERGRETTTAQTPETEKKSGSDKNTSPLPAVNFSSFIVSLSSSVLFHFGEIPDPVTNKKQRNLPMAKQTIDILGMIEEKTRGNLTKDEDALLKNLLQDLRFRYVSEVDKEKK